MGVLASHKTKSILPLLAETSGLVCEIKERLRKNKKTVLPLKETFSLLEKLTEFELGRFLLHNRGLNGYWTSYIFQHQLGKPVTHEMEDWILNRSLFCQIRERFQRCKILLTNFLPYARHMASIPCGVMDDLLDLDYRDSQVDTITGIDLDMESIQYAQKKAEQVNLSDKCKFIMQDAWYIEQQESFDVITSNGLNMYEPDPQRLIALYRSFNGALKPNGTLLISFVPPPPSMGENEAAWTKYNMSMPDLLREFSIFGDIIRIRYLNFVSEMEMEQQLKSSGFNIKNIDYNSMGLFPIVEAVKSKNFPAVGGMA